MFFRNNKEFSIFFLNSDEELFSISDKEERVFNARIPVMSIVFILFSTQIQEIPLSRRYPPSYIKGSFFIGVVFEAMGVTGATAGALCLSSLTLLFSLYAVYVIYVDVHSIWSQLDDEIGQFKIATDQIWADMMTMGAGTPSNRQRRQGKDQYGNYEAQGVNPPPVCSCQSGNGNGDDSFGTGGCPRGPEGPAGSPGHDGFDGRDGVPGFDGEDAEDFQDAPFNGCIVCPPGKIGEPGPVGKPGIRGMRGRRGNSGVPGNDGNPGMPGEMGNVGAPGFDGKMGAPGTRHFHKLVYILYYFIKLAWKVRWDSRLGNFSRNSKNDTNQGAAGQLGDEGAPGQGGRAGDDSLYCPCPGRDGKKGFDASNYGSAPGHTSGAGAPAASYSGGTGGYSGGVGHAINRYG
ncbi:hypothetical protein WR25_03190 isoform B [Diploscapter pachys]|uniref:Nematode cuticle collagen N-terminal domain-containing protein n=1 Tax=Diploscapter pachys TaxID=2018661 RepID=A0A2A2KZ10_9BILA|nr:hypothetical protein WR25_03190 isoform A [Diploscapter pachys]PAV79090.1 hypothetical protein WR25_03190 isoform B [Diploscapter pachys]